MVVFRDDFYIVQASQVEKYRGKEIIRTVLVPAAFSLLQLHVVLLELFGWDETRDSYHSFRHLPYTKNENNLTTENPDVIYQLVSPDTCEGWIKNIAPGLFIEHTHPHDPAPLFSLHNLVQSKDLLTMRILRDERVYKLRQVFGISPMIEYEYESGIETHTARKLCLTLLETVSPESTLLRQSDECPVILEALSKNQIPPRKEWDVDLWSLQEKLTAAHSSGVDSSKCYLCRRYHGGCTEGPTFLDTANCCDFCLHHQLQKIEPLQESLAQLAWEQGREELIIERIKFLNQHEKDHQCDWWEETDEPCCFCSSSVFSVPTKG
ncbi:hypothetical protein K493DRAFT_308943 [Basidiobolus meristosporus CBS 931.73]|uniref:Uncharacterized protein n=1 Tax=Basidiobolus meristosporus CBS 931.73 TaxID=1314790 RepID=A0A1Y1WV27_9FUNG|nr:hypothetical protein K493DRAFT_308943 [Basidiobolus meristosporus CBS 931.73]|eukprot:ORX77066.1 hypothetical protein K493DRAFT_308943 [Basidiobolus meristosporus CBS 931.73]